MIGVVLMAIPAGTIVICWLAYLIFCLKLVGKTKTARASCTQPLPSEHSAAGQAAYCLRWPSSSGGIKNRSELREPLCKPVSSCSAMHTSTPLVAVRAASVHPAGAARRLRPGQARRPTSATCCAACSPPSPTDQRLGSPFEILTESSYEQLVKF